MLVLRALEVRPSQLENFPVIPPEKSTDDEAGQPGHHNLRPLRLTKDIGRSQETQPNHVAILDALADVDRDQDGAAQKREDKKQIPAHDGEAHKDCCVHADQPHKILLVCLPQGPDPREQPFPERRRRMHLVGMFQFRGVDDGVVWTEKGEGKGNAGRDTNGGT